MRAQRPLKKRKIGIATQVFIGLGLLVGVFFGEEAAFLKIGGDAPIALLQITVIPYVMVALITSLGRLTLADAKALGLRGGSILLVLWAVGLIVVLLSPLAFPDWPSASFFSVSEIEAAKPVDLLKLFIPANVFSSLSNAVVPAIVVFSILFCLALINVKNKERVLDLLSTDGDGLMEITGFVGKIAPYGVFAITASAAGMDTPAVLNFLARKVPNATAVVYQDKKEVDHMLAAGLPDADAILMAAEEGVAWTILHPKFHLVTPSPTLLFPFGYAVARNDSQLLLYLNTWLLNAEGDGTIDGLYKYWMLGQIKETLPPRWSIIRNVLGWTG